MGKYFDEGSAKQIGERIRKYRKASGFSMEDVSAMTGVSVNTLSSIENGGDTYVSYCIAICHALGIKPVDLFDIKFDPKPIFALPPARQNRPLTTQRVNELFEAGFFAQPRFVMAVLNELATVYGISPESSEVSTALKKLAEEGKLVYTKSGRRNLYVVNEGGG